MQKLNPIQQQIQNHFSQKATEYQKTLEDRNLEIGQKQKEIPGLQIKLSECRQTVAVS